ncbi:MAG: MFS transporter [Bacteroidetes bacterium]|nr:MFS transporter [Bacteroidota bacterium]MBU1115226.1 MFS transporter [Bacteroidota bacterium]MBU1797244.1 MFS transporter [Bacteroidota bacterium]
MNKLGNDNSQENVKIGKFRWVILALVFFATTINYIDRQVIGILAPTLEKEIGWSEIEYGYIVTAFTAAYAIGLLLIGRFMDRLGSKVGYSVALTGWSFAAIGHALASTVFGFGIARFALGFFEAGNFPAAIKTVAEWFPKKERAFATGIFNAGSNVGAVLAPLVVPFITITWGWKEAFIFTGGAGLIWLIFWFWLYDKPEDSKRVSDSELKYIQSDPPDPTIKIPWKNLLKFRGTWAFAIGKLLTDPAWWFYLYWIPKFLKDTYGLTLKEFAAPLIVIYVMADVGSIGGGWLSSFFIKKGWTINKARKTTMLISAITVIPIVFASEASSVWIAVALLSLATAAHQSWSANLFTTVSDMFPRKAVGSVVGLGGMFGAIGGMLIATAAGFILEFTGSYLILFIIAGSLYLIALFIINLLVPEIKEIEMK